MSSKLASPLEIFSTTTLKNYFERPSLQSGFVDSVLEICHVLVHKQRYLLEISLELFFFVPQGGENCVYIVLILEKLLVVRQVVDIHFVLDHLDVPAEVHQSFTQQTVA